jgi:hypothetical protein
LNLNHARMRANTQISPTTWTAPPLELPPEVQELLLALSDDRG